MESKKYYWLKLRKDFFKRHDIRIIAGTPQGEQIVLFYQGSPDEQYISREATLRLPAYMCPNRVVKLDKMLYNANGKIDRKTLQQICKGE